MRAQTPPQVHELFSTRFNGGDLDGLLALYERSAILLLPGSNIPVQGHDAIREALNGFLSLGGKMEMALHDCLQAGDIAVLHSRWTLQARSPEGGVIEMGGTTADVVRRQGDGSWMIVIDHPMGGQVG